MASCLRSYLSAKDSIHKLVPTLRYVSPSHTCPRRLGTTRTSRSDPTSRSAIVRFDEDSLLRSFLTSLHSRVTCAHCQYVKIYLLHAQVIMTMTMSPGGSGAPHCGSAAPSLGPARGPQTPDARARWPRARRLALLSLRRALRWQKAGILVGSQVGLDRRASRPGRGIKSARVSSNRVVRTAQRRLVSHQLTSYALSKKAKSTYLPTERDGGVT